MRPEIRQFSRERLPPWTDALLSSLAEHDRTTYLHSVRVGIISSALWKGFQTPTITPRDMFLAGLLHDIRKADIPESILGKHEPLTEEEMRLIGRHPFEGAVEIMPYSIKLADIIRGHHRFGKNGVIYPVYDEDPDAQEAMRREKYGEIEKAQLFLAMADKADTGVNRNHGVHGVLMEAELGVLHERFKKELAEGIIQPGWLELALNFAWEAGSIQTAVNAH